MTENIEINDELLKRIDDLETDKDKFIPIDTLIVLNELDLDEIMETVDELED